MNLVLKRAPRALIAALIVTTAGCASATIRSEASSVTLASRRVDIAARVAYDEQQLAKPDVSKKERDLLTAEVAGMRARLANGDFQVGDRIVVTITKDSVNSDSLTVRDSLLITISNFPDLSLRGVLRSELTGRVNSYVAEFLRNATVRTQILTRISVTGAVAVPGFYYALPDRPISEVVKLAGGVAPTAELKLLEVYRGTRRILSAKAAEQAMKAGKTLEQLGVQSGDELRIPVKRKVNWQLILQLLFVLSSAFLAVINLIRWYYSLQE